MFPVCRYAYPGKPAAGHSAHAGKRSPALFLCLFYFWHHRSAVVGWTVEKSLLPGGKLHPVSTAAKCHLLSICLRLQSECQVFFLFENSNLTNGSFL